ncbi:MAG: hypothetical protein Q9187_001600, partial [Circinaria calcarea]
MLRIPTPRISIELPFDSATANPLYVQSPRSNREPATATATNATTVSKPPSSYPSSAEALIIKQRLNRPISPHLSIYQPQITWYLSGLNRISGSILSGSFYIFGFSYLIAPLFGWHLESPALAAAFGSLPLAAKLAIKFGFALPFTFHAFNGIRHLVWDVGMQFSNKQIQRTGWAVVGLS